MYVSGSMFQAKTKGRGMKKKMGEKGLAKGNPEGFEGGKPGSKENTKTVKAPNSKMKLKSANIDANQKPPKKGKPGGKKPRKQ